MFWFVCYLLTIVIFTHWAMKSLPLFSHCHRFCFPDSEHDLWSGVRAAAPEWRAGPEDCSSGRETGLYPPQCSVAACCAFSSNNKATKGFPGRLGLSGPLPVILPELWVLFSPCQAALSRIHHTRDTTQLWGLSWIRFSLMLFFRNWALLNIYKVPSSHPSESASHCAASMKREVGFLRGRGAH